MNLPAAEHPSPDCLRRFGTGQLDAAEAADVAAHVGDCPDCCAVLRGVADDPFTLLVRRAASTDPVSLEGDTTPQCASRLLGEISPDGTSPDGAPATPAVVEVPAELREHPRYRVLELVGHGGMGAVYKAEHDLMRRTVALKLIARDLVERPGMAERFLREIRSVSRLTHPNIAQAHDAEQDGDTLFLVLEFVPGIDLARLVAERGPLPYAEACRYVRQAALALQYAHEQGMVHRDVKPHNLMRTPTGEIKVLDFGLARVVADCVAAEQAPDAPERPTTDASQLTEEGLFMGTADFVAPEQARDAHQADIRADVYGLGCTLFYLLTGQVPFPAGTVREKVDRHATEPPPALSRLRAGLPAGLEAVVRKMMAKRPEQRYPTPGEVAEALAPFATPGETVGSGKRPGGAGRWGRELVAVAAGLLVLAMAVAGVAVYRIQTDQGEIVIEPMDGDVEVVVKQSGKFVRIYDTKTKQGLVLSSGTYELELNGKPTGLKLDPERVTLKRGEKPIVKITRGPPPLAEAKEVFRTRDVPNVNSSLDISPDGRLLLSGHWGSSCIWDVSARKIIHRLDGWIARFTPDGKQVISQAGDLLLYDTGSGKRIRDLPLGGKQIFGFMMCQNRNVITNTADNIYRLWDIETAKVVKSNAVNGTPKDNLWQELWDGKQEEVDKCNSLTGNSIRYILPGRREGMGQNLVDGRAVPVYELTSGRLVRKISLEPEGRVEIISDATHYGRRYGNRMALSSADGTIYIVDLVAGEVVSRLHAKNFRPKMMAISADDRFLAATGAHNEKADLVVWRLPDPPAPTNEAKPQAPEVLPLAPEDRAIAPKSERFSRGGLTPTRGL